MKSKRSAILVFCILVVGVAIPVLAYTYTLQPGYWQNPRVDLWDTSNYFNTVKSASSAWNNLNTKAEVTYYGYNSQPTYHQIRMTSGSYDDLWFGATYLTLSNGVKIIPESAPTWDPLPYRFAWISLNERSMTEIYKLGEKKTRMSICQGVMSRFSW